MTSSASAPSAGRRHLVPVEGQRASDQAAQPFFVFGDNDPRHLIAGGRNVAPVEEADDYVLRIRGRRGEA
jgi:hypothetical protein